MPLALVTGGAGFIGSHLVRALVARGHAVRVVDNLSTGSRDNLEGLSVELIPADIANPTTLRGAARGADVIYHLAAMISVPASLDNPVGCYQTNVLGSLHLLEAARREGVRRVVLASSCAVYGDRQEPVDEDAEPRPQSPYAASKLAMEDLARLYHRTLGLATVCLRFFNVYGPRQDPASPYAAVIPRFIEAMHRGHAATIFGDGEQSRDFVFVEDVVQALLLAAEAPAAPGGTFNIGRGQATTILELETTLRQLFPGAPPTIRAPERPGDIRLSQADIRRATETLGYRPVHDLHHGLQATVEWMRRSLPTASA